MSFPLSFSLWFRFFSLLLILFVYYLWIFLIAVFFYRWNVNTSKFVCSLRLFALTSSLCLVRFFFLLCPLLRMIKCDDNRKDINIYAKDCHKVRGISSLFHLTNCYAIAKHKNKNCAHCGLRWNDVFWLLIWKNWSYIAPCLSIVSIAAFTWNHWMLSLLGKKKKTVVVHVL